MKKYIAFAVALMLIVAMTGCTTTNNGGSSSSSSVTTPAPSTSGAPVSAPKIGMASVTSIGSSKAGTTEDGPKAQADTTMCTVALDDSGKIMAVYFDSVQAAVAFDTKGALKTDITAGVKTKKELGADYGMKKASPIGKEWDEQIMALEKYMVGKTVDEVKKMPVKKKDDAHPSVPDVPELTSSCTIDVGTFIKVLDLAAAKAK